MGGCCSNGESLPTELRALQAVSAGQTGLVIMGAANTRDCHWLDVSEEEPNWRYCGKYQTLQPKDHIALNFKDERTLYRDSHTNRLEPLNEFIISTGGNTPHVVLTRIDKQTRRLIDWHSLKSDETSRIIGNGTAACVFRKRFVVFLGGTLAQRQISVFEFRPDKVPPILPPLPRKVVESSKLIGKNSTVDKKGPDTKRLQSVSNSSDGITKSETELQSELDTLITERRQRIQRIERGSDGIFRRVFLSHSREFPKDEKWYNHHGLVYLERLDLFYLFDAHRARMFSIELPAPIDSKPTLSAPRTVSHFDTTTCPIDGWDDEDRLVVPEDDYGKGKKTVTTNVKTRPSSPKRDMVQASAYSSGRDLTQKTMYDDDDFTTVTQYERYPSKVFDMNIPEALGSNSNDIHILNKELLDPDEYRLPCANSFTNFATVAIHDCVFVFGGCIDEEFGENENRAFENDLHPASQTDLIFGINPVWDYESPLSDHIDGDPVMIGASERTKWRRMAVRLKIPMSDCVAVVSDQKVHILGSDNRDARMSIPLRHLGVTPKHAAIVAVYLFDDSFGRSRSDSNSYDHLGDFVNDFIDYALGAVGATESEADESSAGGDNIHVNSNRIAVRNGLPSALAALIGTFVPFMHLPGTAPDDSWF